MKVLILTTQTSEATALEEGFVELGFEVQIEHSALYAMTLMERIKPDVIVSTDDLSDMIGMDFYDLLRSDPQLEKVPCVFLSRSRRLSQSDMDVVMPHSSTSGDVVQVAYKLMLSIARKSQLDSFSPPATKHSFQGALGELGLFELAQWLSKSNKTGRLKIAMGPLSSVWMFKKGQLLHAEYAQRRGEDAIMHVFLYYEHYKEGTFRFEPMAENSPAFARVTINKHTDQLLLFLAVELDHWREGV
jgi:CheY-like chemotaxis protein